MISVGQWGGGLVCQSAISEVLLGTGLDSLCGGYVVSISERAESTRKTDWLRVDLQGSL